MDLYEKAQDLARNMVGTIVVAHGRAWTVEEARGRVKELEAINADPDGPGPSDGRVTEIENLKDALFSRDERYIESYQHFVKVLEVNEWRRELDALGPAKPEDTLPRGMEKMICFVDAEGRRAKRYYRTEQGFLRALISIRTKGGYIIYTGE
jgi:hypothetical protein